MNREYYGGDMSPYELGSFELAFAYFVPGLFLFIFGLIRPEFYFQNPSVQNYIAEGAKIPIWWRILVFIGIGYFQYWVFMSVIIKDKSDSICFIICIILAILGVVLSLSGATLLFEKFYILGAEQYKVLSSDTIEITGIIKIWFLQCLDSLSFGGFSKMWLWDPFASTYGAGVLTWVANIMFQIFGVGAVVNIYTRVSNRFSLF